jgi:hypothetical protein
MPVPLDGDAIAILITLDGESAEVPGFSAAALAGSGFTGRVGQTLATRAG